MARKESVVCVEFGRGNLGVEVAGDGDRQYIRAMFADWQKRAPPGCCRWLGVPVDDERGRAP